MAVVHRLPNAPLQGGIRDLGGGIPPPHHQPPLMQQPTPSTPDHPAMVREACAAHLLRTAALAPGADHLAPRRVDDAEDRRSGQADLRPVVRRREQTHEPGLRGEAGKQRPRVTRHPARAGPIAHACAGRPPPQGHWAQRGASGCVGRAPLCASTSANTAVINATVRMPLSFPGQDVTFPAWKRRRKTASPNNVSYEFATFSRHCVVCKRRTPLVTKEGQPWFQARDPN
jgi:hypothetical protein